jgi:transposase
MFRQNGSTSLIRVYDVIYVHKIGFSFKKPEPSMFRQNGLALQYMT